MKYLPKIWLSTLFITPLIYWPINVYLNGDSLSNLLEFFPVLFATIFGALILSLPTFLTLNFLLEKMIVLKYSYKIIKSSMSLVGSIGVFLTFLILDSSLFISLKGILFPIIYALIIIVSSWLFKVESSFKNSNFG